MKPSYNLPFFILRNDRLKWSVSGLFDKDKIINDFMNIATKEFEQPNPIKEVYGAPPILWNDEFVTNSMTKSEIDEILQIYDKKGVSVFLTFSCPNLQKKDLDDVSGNYILEKISEGKNNGVIVTSDLLLEYIKTKYPKLKLKNSLLKIASPELKRNQDFYEKMADVFDKVVIFPQDNMNLELLSSLKNKEKFEIIVNNGCIYDCPYYVRCHTKSYDILSYDLNKKFFMENCINYDKQLHTKPNDYNHKAIRNQNLTLKELDEFVKLGFINFNLQGRGEALTPFIYDVAKYIFEPDFIAPLLFKIML